MTFVFIEVFGWYISTWLVYKKVYAVFTFSHAHKSVKLVYPMFAG